jgi:ATP-dependent exoDNAse (exonuclease V) alpha subunit
VFHVNYEYKIVKIKDDFIGLRDASDNKADIIVIPKSLAKNNFIHGYCRTCHSYQGSSIDDNIIILIGTLSM